MHRNFVFSRLLASALALPLAACGDVRDSSLHEERGDLLARAAAGQDNGSGLALFRELAREHSGKNFVFSPTSALGAFSLLYPGTGGASRAGLATAFGFPLDLGSFASQRQALKSRLEASPDHLAPEDTYELNIANDVWLADDFEVKPAYMNLLSTAFGAKAHSLPFQSNPNGSRMTINQAIEKATRDRIRNLLPAGSIQADTRLVLTNAIYLLADWASPFPKQNTFSDTFTDDAGRKSTVDMMNQTTRFSYVARPEFSAVALPYRGGNLEMLVLVPRAGGVDRLVERFDAKLFDAVLSEMEPRKVALSMPRFTLEPDSVSLNDALGRVGAKPIFCGEAGVDLSGISDKESLCVTDVFQKAFLKVDEKGTEAAAATAIVVGRTSIDPERPVEVRVDKPSLFVLYNTETRAVLFASTLAKPE